MESPTVLEVTLRDGSYAINFQFTAKDTAVIAAELDRAGFEMIEIGHGIGLGASRAGMGDAAASDEDYLKAGAESIKDAKWGMFCIPGIATLEDVDMAAGYGMQFIRVGTNVTEVEESEPFVARAKEHGMYVSANFMKSYAMEPSQFAEKAVLTQKFGSDVLCIVDSAGGMLAPEMEEYFVAVRDRCDIPLGFHGHNNLGLAPANAIRALELGATVIDTSMQGLGRSAGNIPTEVFLLLLDRLGIPADIDPLRVMDISEHYIRPLVQQLGYDSIDCISGFALFHSSYMGIIREMSMKYDIDPRKLIIAVTKEDKVNAPREMVERLAKQVAAESRLETFEPFAAQFRLNRFFGAEQTGDKGEQA